METRLEFVLRYHGPLPSNCGLKAKHAIRRHLHPQLLALANSQPFFRAATDPRLPVAEYRQGRLKPLAPHGLTHFRARVGAFEFVPFIHRFGSMVCELTITWLRRGGPGNLLHGGDLDNRLKCLLDGLRMPQDENDLGGYQPSSDAQPLFCLLEDDALIAKLTVSTYDLLVPLARDHGARDVDLLIHVAVRPSGESELLAYDFEYPEAP